MSATTGLGRLNRLQVRLPVGNVKNRSLGRGPAVWAGSRCAAIQLQAQTAAASYLIYLQAQTATASYLIYLQAQTATVSYLIYLQAQTATASYLIYLQAQTATASYLIYLQAQTATASYLIYLFVRGQRGAMAIIWSGNRKKHMHCSKEHRLFTYLILNYYCVVSPARLFHILMYVFDVMQMASKYCTRLLGCAAIDAIYVSLSLFSEREKKCGTQQRQQQTNNHTFDGPGNFLGNPLEWQNIHMFRI